MMALLKRDLAIATRSGGAAMLGVLFFLAVVAVIPFGIGPDLNLLARIGPAILWIGALLASLLGLDRLFQADREDGSLDMLVMQDWFSLVLTVFVKSLAHWLATGLPLVLAAPLLGLLMNMSATATGAVMLTLLVGTPAISFIGAVGAAVAVVLPRGGLLVSILILPLAIPILIFGVSASYAAVTDPDPFLPPFMILSAIALFFAALGPVAAAAALKGAAD
ncbi:heme exporter protein CcmB [Hoeflea ulvae]|uniref:Heme exporter protein B n=1 Tax=Hoeflea ulvae TaxID=2983764 RepID=A0ABT3YA11_9HYPH|nr:heme exporter protein CcmB [Hoeflea ulvae]MCY0092718.1 heme exporter protein CcmB [Hoeflea ulvae]